MLLALSKARTRLGVDLGATTLKPKKVPSIWTLCCRDRINIDRKRCQNGYYANRSMDRLVNIRLLRGKYGSRAGAGWLKQIDGLFLVFP